MVTEVDYLHQELTKEGSKQSLKSLKLVVFDEADEVFDHPDDQPKLKDLFSKLKQELCMPQYLMFSATIDQVTLDNIAKFINPSTLKFFSPSKEPNML